ncbi:MAG: hypothetical protein ACEPO2_14165, partial [Pelagibaca sp.]
MTKFMISRFFLLRSCATNSKYPFTGGVEARLGRQTGRLVGRLVADEVDNSGVYQGGRAGSLGRTGLVVCLLG